MNEELVKSMANKKDWRFSKTSIFLLIVGTLYITLLLAELLLKKSLLVSLVKQFFLLNKLSKKPPSFFEDRSIPLIKGLPRSPRPCTIENVYFKTEDNRTIGAYLIYNNTREDRGLKKFFIFCHGNGGNRDSYTTSYNLRDNLLKYPDAVFLILDYGGFGDSEGEFEIDKVNLDVKAAFEFINKRNNMVRRDIKLIGHSLGCAVALEYCKYISTDDTGYSDFYKPSKVVLLAPFATTLTILKKNLIYRVFSSLFPTLDRNIKTQFFYDNLENIKHAGNNFMVLHGKKDSLIPYTESESIRANSEGKGKFHFFPEKDHFNIPECFGTFCDMDPRGESEAPSSR
ncbi:hypothetical protein GINT2_001178 [Glugoides intestinalis]